jgi:hypothetical protein
METDSSDGVSAGVLSQQQDDGEWKPVAFFSKVMNPEEMRYEIHDKEMLAVIRGLAEWRPLLIGLQNTPFLAITDHRALEYFTTKRLLNPRQARWADQLAEYDLKITYRPGSINTIADILSRKVEVLKTQKEKDIAARTTILIKPSLIAALEDSPAPANQTLNAQESPPPEEQPQTNGIELIDQVLKANREHDSMQKYRDLTGRNGWELKQDLLLRWGKLVVPDVNNIRTKLIHEAHSTLATAHPGRTKTRKLLTDRYYWIGITSDVNRYVDNCRQCHWSHVPRDKTPGLLHPLPIAERCWQHVSFDFKAMPKDKNGNDNVFVIVDRLGKRAFSLPCTREATAATAARLYYEHPWRIYGAPETITSDRGPQFISAFMDELCKLTGVKQKLSTAYHPQTDGNTEILNQYIDQRLRPFINHFQDNWSDLLPAMDFAQAILPHDSTGLAAKGPSNDQYNEECTEIPKRLPNTIEDAIALTINLGYSYIWIDRLCINQTGQSDMHIQINQMQAIYANAAATIIAAIGSDPSSGFPGLTIPRLQQQITGFAGFTLASSLSDPRLSVQMSAWMSRGWTYQEAIFSRRRIFVTPEQIYFECGSMSCSESLILPLERLHCTRRGNQRGYMRTSKYLFQIQPSVTWEKWNKYIHQRLANTFMRQVFEYSRRKLTYQSDILRGFLGVLQSYFPANLSQCHIWGIPFVNDNPGYFLHWDSLCPSTRRHGFPSWSWSGWHGPFQDVLCPQVSYDTKAPFKIWIEQSNAFP